MDLKEERAKNKNKGIAYLKKNIGNIKINLNRHFNENYCSFTVNFNYFLFFAEG